MDLYKNQNTEKLSQLRAMSKEPKKVPNHHSFLCPSKTIWEVKKLNLCSRIFPGKGVLTSSGMNCRIKELKIPSNFEGGGLF